MAVKHPAIKALDEIERWIEYELNRNIDQDYDDALQWFMRNVRAYRKKHNT